MTPRQGDDGDGHADASGFECPPGSRARQRGAPVPLTLSRSVGRAILGNDHIGAVGALPASVTAVTEPSPAA